MQTKKKRLLFDLTGGVIIMRRSIGNRFQSLMRPKVVVVINIFFDDYEIGDLRVNNEAYELQLQTTLVVGAYELQLQTTLVVGGVILGVLGLGGILGPAGNLIPAIP